jgi:hypothetical protein
MQPRHIAANPLIDKTRTASLATFNDIAKRRNALKIKQSRILASRAAAPDRLLLQEKPPNGRDSDNRGYRCGNPNHASILARRRAVSRAHSFGSCMASIAAFLLEKVCIPRFHFTPSFANSPNLSQRLTYRLT